MTDQPDFQILSLSGGGARGLYTIAVLAKIEEYLSEQYQDEQYWIGKHFDLICGTSVGGLLAMGLATGITARHLAEVMEQNLSSIFPSIVCKKLRQARKPAFDAAPLKKLLVDLFNEKTIGDISKTRLLVPAINYTKGGVQVFKTPHNPLFIRDHKARLVDVALATSAAPTYFPIHEYEDNWYVDGGLAANSPVLMGIHEALHFLGVTKPQLRVLLVGTMGERYTANQSKSRDRGYHGWGYGTRLIGLTLAANEGLHNDIARHMVEPGRLVKLDTPQTDEQNKVLGLDKASAAAISTLRASASNIVQQKLLSPELQAILHHTPQVPKLYHGPNRNTDGDSE